MGKLCFIRQAKSQDAARLVLIFESIDRFSQSLRNINAAEIYGMLKTTFTAQFHQKVFHRTVLIAGVDSQHCRRT